MKLRAATFLVSAYLLVSPALGGPESAGAHDKGEVIPTWFQGAAPKLAALVVFGIVFAVLASGAWPKIAKGLADRENKLRSEIEAAELARKQAKEALEEYQQSLQQARAEAQRMIDQAKSQQLAVAASEKAKLEAELAKERERALRDIEAAKKAAVGELYNQSAALATTLAGKILKRNITPSDHQQLIDESLVQMQGLRN
jgi:F-type H+-transporting ATPase subunit b